MAMTNHIPFPKTKFRFHIPVICLLFSFSVTGSGQYKIEDTSNSNQEQFKWPEGKRIAISLSFDDGRTNQVDYGVPLFDKYNVKATFYISPGNFEQRLEKWKKAAKNGHEIANHTINHPCSGNFPFAREKALEDYTLQKIAKDIDDANDYIENHTGIRPETFAYPCGQQYVGSGKNVQSYIPLVAERFTAGRGWLDEAPNDPFRCDMSQIYGMRCDGYDFTHIKELIEKTEKIGGWLVLAGHSILPEGKGLTTFMSMLEELCAYANDPVNGVWIATVKDVATYVNNQRELSQNETPPYLDRCRSIEKRVEDLLGRMTLAEKIGQMNMPCMYSREMGNNSQKKLEAAKKFAEGTHNNSIGPGGGIFTVAHRDLKEGSRQQAEFINELQKIAVEKTRLGIPLLLIEEGTHGLMCADATIFPMGLSLGSAWDMDIVKDIYSVAAKEARTRGIHELYTIVVEPNRDPRLGRNEECFSEDPYLCARIAESVVKGTQGDDISAPDKAIAGLCHYPGQSEAVGGAEQGAMYISERVLREVFLPPWEAGIKKAGALGVMAAHPAIDGVPTHCSYKLLTKILREELGFNGLVVSEGMGISTIMDEKVADSYKEAGKMALNAGLDVGISYESGYMLDMIENVKEGNVSIEAINRAVSRILKIKFRLGLFENLYVDPDYAEKVSHTKESQELAYRAAQEGIVLLKNEQNLLPLKKDIKSIAVIGPNADHDRNILGDYTSATITQDIVTVLDGIKMKVSDKTKVTYVKGCNVIRTNLNEIEKARDAAKNAEVAIVVVGENERRVKDEGRKNVGVKALGVDEHTKSIGTNGEGKDVVSLELTGYQQELIKAVYKTGTPTVVVLINGRPLSIRWVAEHIPAIIEGWRCGEKGGDAIADILFGDYNPSGKLAITIPRHVGQLPMYYNYSPRKEGYIQKRGYVDMSPTPLYEFGFGLSYTTFEYSNLQITPESIGTAGNINVSINLKNTGERKGKEVVQLYINDVISSIVTPIKELKGFEKISLKPGEKKIVRFTLTPEDLAYVGKNMLPVVEPGTFDVMVGSSCEDISLRGSFEVDY